MSFTLKILGCSSATPTLSGMSSSQHLVMEGRSFLIDCGEGAQMQLRKQKINFRRINHIFISHLHGDHFFGLIGLISTMHTTGRGEKLHIYSPKGLKEIIIVQLKNTKTFLSYFIEFHEISTDKPIVILDDKKLTVKAIPLKHRIEAYGYLFEEKEKERKLNITEVEKYNIEVCDYQNIKLGKDYITPQGKIIRNTELTFNPKKPLKYAYCSDTAYEPKLIEWLKNIDLLYHESTFLETNIELAIKTGHSTAKQAANIAKQANVKRLLLGHFSARYKDRNVFFEEAKKYFDYVDIASKVKEISF